VAGHEHYDQLSAGHALNALEPADELEFVAHLDGCVECQRSLAEFSELAAGLAMSSHDEPDEPPPPQVWAGISARVHSEESVPQLDRRRREPRRRVWLGAAASAVLVAAGVVGWQIATTGSSDSSVQSALASCERSTGCRVVQLTGSTLKPNSTYLLVRGQDVRVATSSLPAVDASRETYVLWQMPQDGRPVGVVAFAVAANHAALVAHGTLPLPYTGTTAFAITREQGTSIPPAPSAPVAVGAATSA
jgi:hypothetical protein